MQDIHRTALVHPDARLDDGVSVGPYAVIEGDTAIGAGCHIGACAVIKRYTRMGRGNRVYEHAVIGGEPQDVKFAGASSFVDIGDDNVIREGVTIHRSTMAGGATRIGDANMLMAYCHVAHDCRIGSGIALANGALLAGFVEVGDRAFVSGAVTVHQFCRIGTLAMVSQSTRVTMDCLPYFITEGSPARARGVNLVGLRRAGLADGEVKQVRQIYRLMRSGRGHDVMLRELSAMAGSAAAELARFMEASKRGYVHAL